MLDIKALKIALEQLEQERRISKERLIDAVEQSLGAAYKKEYGKKGQIIRARIDLEEGIVAYEQVKIVVDDTMVRFDPEETEDESYHEAGEGELERYNEEKHILLGDAQLLKSDVLLGEEMVFPLEEKQDFGRIAAQTAKQVIMQRIREAEKDSVMSEFGGKEGDIISGYVQKVEGGIVYLDFNRATGMIMTQEQIPGERFTQGSRVRAYLYQVEEGARGIILKLSRTHPKFLERLFAYESPEIANGAVQIKSIAREAGSRSKIAVATDDPNIDPVGSCVGGRGVRVVTVMEELGGEKIDIIEWSADPEEFVRKALSPAKVVDISIYEEEKKALVTVTPDQLSLAIGKGGQNVRLAARLTGWRIDIQGTNEAITSQEDEIAIQPLELPEETPETQSVETGLEVQPEELEASHDEPETLQEEKITE